GGEALVTDGAVFARFAVGDCDDRSDAQGGRRVEHAGRDRFGREKKGAHRTKMVGPPLLFSPCVFSSSRSTTGRARAGWSGWSRDSPKASPNGGMRRRWWQSPASVIPHPVRSDAPR